MKRLRLAILLGAALVWAAPVRAQSADTAAVQHVLRTVCPGAEVRLAVAAADSVRGVCGAVQDGRLAVRWAGDERVVPVARIDGVWVRVRGTQRAAKIGGFVGALVVGGGVAYGMYGMCDLARGCASDALTAGTMAAFLGAFAGAATGALIGSRMHVWDRRYP